MSDIEKLGYSPAQFCAAFPIKKTKLYELMASGEIVAKKSGGQTIIPADEATRWLDSLPPLALGKKSAA